MFALWIDYWPFGYTWMDYDGLFCRLGEMCIWKFMQCTYRTNTHTITNTMYMVDGFMLLIWLHSFTKSLMYNRSGDPMNHCTIRSNKSLIYIYFTFGSFIRSLARSLAYSFPHLLVRSHWLDGYKFNNAKSMKFKIPCNMHPFSIFIYWKWPLTTERYTNSLLSVFFKK